VNPPFSTGVPTAFMAQVPFPFPRSSFLFPFLGSFFRKVHVGHLLSRLSLWQPFWAVKGPALFFLLSVLSNRWGNPFLLEPGTLGGLGPFSHRRPASWARLANHLALAAFVSVLFHVSCPRVGPTGFPFFSSIDMGYLSSPAVA